MQKLKVKRGNSDKTRELNVPLMYSSGICREKFMSINNHIIRVDITNDPACKPTEINVKDVLYTAVVMRKNLKLAMDVEYSFELKNIVFDSKPVCINKLEIINVLRYDDGKLLEMNHEEIINLARDQLKDIVLIPGFAYMVHHLKSDARMEIRLTLDEPCYYTTNEFTIKDIELSKNASKKIILLDSFTQDNSIFKNDFNLQKLGIGGLKKECQEFFRRALCSRACHPDLIKELKINHCKGVILYGPPGTGKTLIARQLAKIMNSHPPKIINGPEILNKFVGESEANLRNLFIDAEQEYKEKGEFSKLHVIIFDEFDCIARKRSSDSSGTQVSSNVVNQFLSKMDGVDILNNILIIGLTNRIDLIDKALLRPGRFEVCIEIGIPDATDRLEILQIYLEQLVNKGLFQNAGLTLEELVSMTENFSGAEIAGMVRNVTSYAIEREVSSSQNQENKDKALKNWDNLKIEKNDFIQSINSINKTKSHHGKQLDILISDTPPEWSHEVNTQLDALRSIIKTYLYEDVSCYHGQSLKILITGKKRKGKSTLSAYIAKELSITNIIYSSNFDLLGKLDSQKALFLKELFQDAVIPHESIMILDDIDQMIEISYKNHHQIYSNTILQTFKTLFSMPVPNKLIFITTASSQDQINNVELLESFHNVIDIS